LDSLPGPYFIIEDKGTVIGCGGWALDSEDVAALTWGMVRRDYHQRGIGRELLRYRIQAIRDDGRAKVLRLRTIPRVQGFFAREGFNVVDIVPDGYGPGMDRVTMELLLNATA